MPLDRYRIRSGNRDVGILTVDGMAITINFVTGDPLYLANKYGAGHTSLLSFVAEQLQKLGYPGAAFDQMPLDGDQPVGTSS